MRVSRSLARSAELDLDRRSVEVILPADLVLEIARVREVHRRRAIHEEHGRGRWVLRLGHVMKTYLFAIPITRRWMRGDRLGEEAMQVRRGDPLLALVDHRDGRGQGVLHAAAGLRGDQPMVHPRRE